MEETEKLYSPSCWSRRINIPEVLMEHHLRFIEDASFGVNRQYSCQMNVSYGKTERQKFDIIGTDLSDDAPIVVFIHGGYWQTFEITKSSYHFIAKNLHKNGVKTIFIGYDLCPDVTLSEIVSQIKTAIKKCLKYALEKNSKGVYLMGHSAGAHLIASLFTTTFINTLQKEESLIKAAILISGVFDLTPLQKTTVNENLKLDETEALELSPMRSRISSGMGTVFHLIVGANESPEFIRQTKEFAGKLGKSGFQVESEVVADVDHFNIIERLSEMDFQLTQKLIKIATKE